MHSLLFGLSFGDFVNASNKSPNKCPPHLRFCGCYIWMPLLVLHLKGACLLLSVQAALLERNR